VEVLSTDTNQHRELLHELPDPEEAAELTTAA
jgi:hypothetical protein